jgi:hypothetical protein
MLFFQSIRSLEIWLGKQMDLSIVMRVHDNVLKSIAEKKEIAEIE